MEIVVTPQTLILVETKGSFLVETQKDIPTYVNSTTIYSLLRQCLVLSYSSTSCRIRWIKQDEEQELTMFLEELPYEEEDEPLSEYESIYSEPIYGESSLGSYSNWEPNSTVLYDDGLGSENRRELNLTLAHNSAKMNCSSVDTIGVPIQLKSFKLHLPKLSTIARSAGKKFSKHLEHLRRLSRTPTPTSDSSSFLSLPNSIRVPIYGNYQSPSLPQNLNSIKPLKQKVISRHQLPPPPPPPTHPIKYCKKVKEEYDESDAYNMDSQLIRKYVSRVQPIYSMEEEPLYQYYSYGLYLQKPEDSYEPMKNLGVRLDKLVPRTGQRTLWSQVLEVQQSGILEILSPKQKELQEAIFEVLTSEASYLKSLDVLISLFYHNQDLMKLLAENERAKLFGNITTVKTASKSFLSQLLAKWEESWYITEVGQLILDNCQCNFRIYIDYCRNKPYQDVTTEKLRKSEYFINIIQGIETNPKCELLPMASFLMLPMQRVTRLPLLVNAILQRSQNSKEKLICEEALSAITKLVIECNNSARESQEILETETMMKKLEFPRGLKQMKNSGEFLFRGNFQKNPIDSTKPSWTFQKNKRIYCCLILFTQQLVITKVRSSGKLEVVDVMPSKETRVKLLPSLDSFYTEYQHYFMLYFDNSQTLYFFAGKCESEIEKWRTTLNELRIENELVLKTTLITK